MPEFDFEKYGPVCATLLREAPPMELGPGAPHRAVHDQLRGLEVASLFPGATLRDEQMARCCLAGLWLRHHFLHQSHEISQQIHTTTGSYWHGIMHRREPDYSNAKYWFRQVGPHAIYAELQQRVRQLAADHSSVAAQRLAESSDWDPFRFVDLCESAARGSEADREFCVRVAEQEWELLFDYCYGQATGE